MTRRLNPATALSSFVSAWDFPARNKPAKMIDARNISRPQSCPHPFDPPTKTVCPHSLPIKKWIAPVLSSLAEVIRRHARNNRGSPIGIKLELILIDPNIGRVVRDEHRNVADDLHPTLIAVCL